jgi:hypothetical protein
MGRIMFILYVHCRVLVAVAERSSHPCRGLTHKIVFPHFALRLLWATAMPKCVGKFDALVFLRRAGKGAKCDLLPKPQRMDDLRQQLQPLCQPYHRVNGRWGLGMCVQESSALQWSFRPSLYLVG